MGIGIYEVLCSIAEHWQWQWQWHWHCIRLISSRCDSINWGALLRCSRFSLGVIAFQLGQSIQCLRSTLDALRGNVRAMGVCAMSDALLTLPSGWPHFCSAYTFAPQRTRIGFAHFWLRAQPSIDGKPLPLCFSLLSLSYQTSHLGRTVLRKVHQSRVRHQVPASF